MTFKISTRDKHSSVFTSQHPLDKPKSVAPTELIRNLFLEELFHLILGRGAHSQGRPHNGFVKRDVRLRALLIRHLVLTSDNTEGKKLINI